MNFEGFLTAFVGRTVEAATISQSFTGTLQQVTTTTLQLAEAPTPYGPGATVIVPTVNVDYVRAYL
ncbi:MAG: hypothetical protein K6T78_00770 [Alicyclobacillus sp.]|nr:hypothetical protein [Alicyclobacillus sp.]